MTSFGPDSAHRGAQMLEYLRHKGVRFFTENGQLRYKALKGTLTPEDIQGLKSAKDQIVDLLERSSQAEPHGRDVESQPHFEYVALAFPQLSHWHSYRLNERRAIRQIASATRLQGYLDLDALRQSLAAVVARHGALRTRIVQVDGVPTQQVASFAESSLEVEDLSCFTGASLDSEVRQRIEAHIMEPIDPAIGPLFGVWLLRLHDAEHVLVVAMEHMISDAFSMTIMLRDLFCGYNRKLAGDPTPLPPIPVQYADHAISQRSALQTWLDRHAAYWSERLHGQRSHFPERRLAPTRAPDREIVGWGNIPLRIDRTLKAALRDWSRLRATTVVMSAFTAYIALVLRWCQAEQAVIQYQTSGRNNPEIQNTIGYFASVLYLKMELHDEDSFLDLMRRVTEEFCSAWEHADSGYLEAQVPKPEFTQSTSFNWVSQESPSDVELDGPAGTLRRSPIRFEHPMMKTLDWDSDPSVLLFELDDEVVGDIGFPLNRFSTDTMARFSRNFFVFIDALLTRPEGRVKDVQLVQ
jgi:Condensation domain/TubC N-terminal docking domain